jgi:hypothetical protein
LNPVGLRGFFRALLLLGAATALSSCTFEFLDTTPSRSDGSTELAQLWAEPRDLEQRDLYYGIGGADLAPPHEAIFAYHGEKEGLTTAFSPGLDVEDPRGVVWSVKLGAEANPEVLASRIIWAVGYHQPPTYLVERWKLGTNGAVNTYPASRFRTFDRLHRNGNWSWHDNPFVGTQAFRGLIVLMAVINNWDLTVENTGIYDLDRPWDGARRWYVVRDSGASFSRNRGSLMQGTRGDVAGFEQQGFVSGIVNGHVVFDWKGPHADLFDDIAPADVRWTCALLARLRPQQWRDAFRAAGYGEADAERLKARLDERITIGEHVGA